MEDNIELYNNEKSLKKKKNENSSHRRYPYGMILLRNAQSNTLLMATCSRNVRLNRLYQLQKAASFPLGTKRGERLGGAHTRLPFCMECFRYSHKNSEANRGKCCCLFNLYGDTEVDIIIADILLYGWKIVGLKIVINSNKSRQSYITKSQASIKNSEVNLNPH